MKIKKGIIAGILTIALIAMTTVSVFAQTKTASLGNGTVYCNTTIAQYKATAYTSYVGGGYADSVKISAKYYYLCLSDGHVYSVTKSATSRSVASVSFSCYSYCRSVSVVGTHDASLNSDSYHCSTNSIY